MNVNNYPKAKARNVDRSGCVVQAPTNQRVHITDVIDLEQGQRTHNRLKCPLVS
jgi:hypothetical protein